MTIGEQIETVCGAAAIVVTLGGAMIRNHTTTQNKMALLSQRVDQNEKIVTEMKGDHKEHIGKFEEWSQKLSMDITEIKVSIAKIVH